MESDLQCARKNCKEKAILGCLCCKPIYPMCKKHCHLNKPLNEGHKAVSLWREVSYLERTILIEVCKSRIQRINKYRNKALSESIHLVNTIQFNTKAILKNLNEIQKKLEELLAFSIDLRSIRDFGNLSQMQMGAKLLIENPNYCESFLSMPSENFDASLLINNIIEPKVIFQEEKEKNIEFPYIIAPVSNTKSIMKIDLQDFTIIKADINSSCNFSYASGWCVLPSGDLFITGGAYECRRASNTFNNALQKRIYKLTANTLIINLITKEAKDLKPYIEISDMGSCTFYKNQVFVFGGYNADELLIADSSKYDIQQNQWYSIQELPKCSGYNSSALLGDYIYITGNSLTNVLCYQINNNFYDEVFNVTSRSSFLIKGHDSLYLFDNDKIIQFNGNNWKCINKIVGFNKDFLLTHSSIYNNCIYFTIGQYSISLGIWTKSSLLRYSIEHNDLVCVRQDFY